MRMTVSTTMFINRNVPEHGIFRKDLVKMGESWLGDKYTNTLIGGTEGKKVVEYGTTWDEETEEQIDYRNVIKECDRLEEAIDYACEYFHVTKVYDDHIEQYAIDLKEYKEKLNDTLQTKNA